LAFTSILTDSIGAIEWGRRSQLKKPGFSDNSSIAAEMSVQKPGFSLPRDRPSKQSAIALSGF